MSRPLILFIFAVGLLVGLGGVYALLKPPAAPAPAAAPLDAAAIYAQAEARVQKQPVPQKPEGAHEVAPKTLPVRIPTSHLVGAALKNIPVPQIVATTQAEKSCQDQVNAQQAAYVQALQREIDQITKAQADADAARRAGASDWITSVLIPLIATITGFITALASLIAALRPKAAGQAS
jgi:hypothetical protein